MNKDPTSLRDETQLSCSEICVIFIALLVVILVVFFSLLMSLDPILVILTVFVISLLFILGALILMKRNPPLFMDEYDQ